MSITDVMFFFDTEDFTCDESQTAAKRLAEICTEEGVTGHFAVVGKVAERLRNTGREDVIDALKKHEIGTHTWAHSVHPNICQMTDCEDFSEAYARASQSEGKALDMLRSVFDRQDILFAVPPGDCHSYPAMYYYVDAGVPCNCGTYLFDEQRTLTYCTNALHTAYDIFVEWIAFDGYSIADELEKYVGKKQVIIATHPNVAVFREFWDMHNFNRKNLRAEGEDFIIPPRRTEEETRHYYDTFRAIIRAVKADPRFRLTSLREVLAAQPARTPVTPADIPAIREALLKDYAPLYGRNLCLYDIFMAAVSFLAGKEEYLPGKAYGLLYSPEEITSPVTLTVSGVREAAASVAKDTFLPPFFLVDGQKIGTGDMLYAMLAALGADGERITLNPHPEMTFLRRYPGLYNLSQSGKWVHSDDFKDEFLSDRMRLQAWTIR